MIGRYDPAHGSSEAHGIQVPRAHSDLGSVPARAPEQSQGHLSCSQPLSATVPRALGSGPGSRKSQNQGQERPESPNRLKCTVLRSLKRSRHIGYFPLHHQFCRKFAETPPITNLCESATNRNGKPFKQKPCAIGMHRMEQS